VEAIAKIENKYIIGIFGLGYVGLSLAIAFSKKFNTLCYDINLNRINELKDGKDKNKLYSKKELSDINTIKFTNRLKDLSACNFYVVCVQTPIKNRLPDLDVLKKACDSLGTILKTGDFVTFESTVYPGVTEEICIPILEKKSKLSINKDFYCGYSPERISPGENSKELVDIDKIISGSNNYCRDIINKLYSKILNAKTHKVSSISCAECIKLIENVQRDVNIALTNEFAIIIDKLNLSVSEVLGGASTKWNFHKYKPGLVGGHCISVDPYYLSTFAKQKI